MNPSIVKKPGWRYGLGSLMLGVLGCALVLGIMANTHESYELIARFARLPPDDQALTDWLQSQDEIDLASVDREGDRVRIRYSMKAVLPVFRPVAPPFSRWGYAGLKGTTHRIVRPSPLGVIVDWIASIPARAWAAIALVASLIVVQRLRHSTRKSPRAGHNQGSARIPDDVEGDALR